MARQHEGARTTKLKDNFKRENYSFRCRGVELSERNLPNCFIDPSEHSMSSWVIPKTVESPLMLGIFSLSLSITAADCMLSTSKHRLKSVHSRVSVCRVWWLGNVNSDDYLGSFGRLDAPLDVWWLINEVSFLITRLASLRSSGLDLQAEFLSNRIERWLCLKSLSVLIRNKEDLLFGQLLKKFIRVYVTFYFKLFTRKKWMA